MFPLLALLCQLHLNETRRCNNNTTSKWYSLSSQGLIEPCFPLFFPERQILVFLWTLLQHLPCSFRSYLVLSHPFPIPWLHWELLCSLMLRSVEFSVLGNADAIQTFWVWSLKLYHPVSHAISFKSSVAYTKFCWESRCVIYIIKCVPLERGFSVGRN